MRRLSARAASTQRARGYPNQTQGQRDPLHEVDAVAVRVEPGVAGCEVGDQHVDLVPRERRVPARGARASTRRPPGPTSLADPASAILTSASSSVASLAPTSGSTAAALTNSSTQQQVACGAGGQRSDQAAGPRVELAAGEQGGHAGVVLHRPERVGPVGEDGDVARFAEAGGEPLHRRRRVDADRAAGADEIEQLLRDACLGAGVLPEARLEAPGVPRPPRRRALSPRCLRRPAGRGRAGWSSR